jgi:hypothetical protein
MPVVAGSSRCLLFCEGKPDSYDVAILNRLVSGPSFQVVPAGGKYALPAFIEGYVGGKEHQGRLVAFRDRDFDAEPTDQVTLLRLPVSRQKEIYLSHRACIENYLLDPELIHRYWDESSEGPKWSHKKPPAPKSIRSWIEESARDIADYQAVRWALAKLKPGDPWPSVRSTWMPNSGKLPDDLAFAPCLECALELVKRFRCATLPVNKRALAAHADQFRRRFQEESFWKTGAYMVWFHGKDLKKAMNKRRPGWISLDPFCQWAAERLDWANHPDLGQLARLLSS